MNFFSKKTSTTIAFKQTKQTFFYNYYEPLENTALDHCSEFTQFWRTFDDHWSFFWGTYPQLLC